MTRTQGPEAPRRWYQGWFQHALDAYGRSLRRVLEHQTLTLVIALATLASSAALYIVVPKGFFPTQDTGAISAVVEAPPAVSFDATIEAQRAMARMVLEDPAVDGLSSFIGVDGINPTQNRGRMLIELEARGGEEEHERLSGCTAPDREGSAIAEGSRFSPSRYKTSPSTRW